MLTFWICASRGIKYEFCACWMASFVNAAPSRCGKATVTATTANKQMKYCMVLKRLMRKLLLGLINVCILNALNHNDSRRNYWIKYSNETRLVDGSDQICPLQTISLRGAFLTKLYVTCIIKVLQHTTLMMWHIKKTFLYLWTMVCVTAHLHYIKHIRNYAWKLLLIVNISMSERIQRIKTKKNTNRKLKQRLLSILHITHYLHINPQNSPFWFICNKRKIH